MTGMKRVDMDDELEVRIGIRVTKPERAQLQKAARREGSISTVIRRLIRKEFAKRKATVKGLAHGICKGERNAPRKIWEG